MRQEHRAGEKLFADYAGQTLPILDPTGGPASAAPIFVAVLGASNYTYACATPSEGTADWIGGLVGALTYVRWRHRTDRSRQSQGAHLRRQPLRTPAQPYCA